MEPCGFVRSLRYAGLIQGRDAKPVKKATRPPVAPGAVLGRRLGRTIASSGETATPCDNPAMSRPLATRSVILVLTLSALVLACDPAAVSPSPTARRRRRRAVAERARRRRPDRPSPGASQDAAAIYDAIEDQVAALRGLQPTSRSPARSSTRRRSGRCSPRSSTKETPPEYVAANERLYKALGLLPADADLRRADPRPARRRRRRLLPTTTRASSTSSPGRAASGRPSRSPSPTSTPRAPGPELDGLQGPEGRASTRATGSSPARPSTRATRRSLMTQWAIAQPDPGRARRVRRGGQRPGHPGRSSATTPPILRETLTFPYTTGAFYVQSAQTAGGWAAVDAFYDRMPESTEQILHPEKYAANEAPVAVDLPGRPRDAARDRLDGPADRTRSASSRTAIWLRESGVPTADADRGGRRLGRRPPRGHRGPGRRLGRRHARPPGTPTPTPPRSRPPRRPRWPRRRRIAPGPARRGRHDPLGRSSRATPPRCRSVAGVARPGRLAARAAAASAVLHRLGRGDPEQRRARSRA